MVVDERAFGYQTGHPHNIQAYRLDGQLMNISIPERYEYVGLNPIPLRLARPVDLAPCLINARRQLLKFGVALNDWTAFLYTNDYL